MTAPPTTQKRGPRGRRRGRLYTDDWKAASPDVTVVDFWDAIRAVLGKPLLSTAQHSRPAPRPRRQTKGARAA